jgi:ADP-ribosyl-[dinitrogen reductase] hydrolase
MRDKLLGGLYGALIGDACGVPYEFTRPNEIPPYDQIDMTPPKDFDRTWENIPVGTYSDDGAQLLCLTENLLDHRFSASELHATLRRWRTQGYMSVDQNTFDIGNQTIRALMIDVNDVRTKLNLPSCNGNGSLMRTLGVIYEFHTEQDIAYVASELSCATHPHNYSRICCAAYCLIANYLLAGIPISEAIDRAFTYLENGYKEDAADLEFVKSGERNELRGTGYVVDSFWSAIYAVWRGTSYEDVVKKAIQYGNDTDTTACIAGGLAGIIYGYKGLPPRWLDTLRGKELIQPIADRIAYKGY